jgi:hypothetical protein
MNPRAWRLFVLVGLVCVTWLLLAQFVWLSSDMAHRDEALPYGGVAFAAYLLTIGYAVYYRTYWAEPRVVTGRESSPMLRWVATIVVVGAFGVTLGVAFPDVTSTPDGLLFVHTVTFGLVGFGLVMTLSKRPAAISESLADPAVANATPPTFGTSALRVGAWQVYGFVGAALLFAPIYLVMKGFETYVDIPACERTCETRGYAYESLVTGKSTYNCNCRGSDGRHTFHERAHVGGGTGAASAVVDWGVRTATVLGTLGAWLALLFGGVYLMGGRNPDGFPARSYRAVVGFMVPNKQARSAQAPKVHAPKPPKVKNRSRRRS